ncbi:tetratricopeptide repeat protein [Phytoactinopolyspora halotolerans]|uniref:Tetratricopeptide repeat protein n=1 Tax=Phytoactinopolyspora halotolerans TaxID=1981512 RepID=A0A6L9S967_9ACTN|nr:tetratricopeptide repeat protein [Phytoactinopolyspora halotolerans]
MRFEVLGTVRIVRDDGAVPVSEQRRRLLSVLLARANRVVSADALGEVLWGEDPSGWPSRSDKSLQMHIHRLRRVLDAPDRLRGESGGYLLQVAAGELDAGVFAERHAAAREAAAAGRLDDAVRLYREGLAQWRGEPYADVDQVEVVGPESARLTEARLAAYEELYETELEKGAFREIVPELTERVAEYPLRERFAFQLMRALWHSGRPARALTTYRQLRRRLAESLRTEPGAELRELYERIQAESPDPSVGAGSPDDAGDDRPSRPRQLPPGSGVFIGRATELAEIERACADDGAAVLVATGTAGVGKTTVALRYAHAVADRYPDGQLYIDLRGHATAPALEPIEALTHLLRGLGADPGSIPTQLSPASAEYRSLLAERKVLVLLDNAASAQQVRPLLPASPGCLALVTSRDRLLGLVAKEGAHPLRLRTLPDDEAYELLVSLLGEERIAAEPEQARALIDACAGLPLALRIAAAQLADQPRRTVAGYVAELRAAPLTTLEIQDDDQSAVAAAFDLSYQRLPDGPRRLFRLLGLVPGPDFTPDAASALSGESPQAVRGHLRRLETAHLVEEHAVGRYRFHDLLRDFAAHCAEAEESVETRSAAIDRLMAWYYQGKEAASRRFRPESPKLDAPAIPDGLPEIVLRDAFEAASWSQAEHRNIAAAIARAASSGPQHWTWHLALGHCVAVADSGYITDSIAMIRSAVRAARETDDRHALAHATAQLATVLARLDTRQAVDTLTDAARQAEQNSDPILLGYCLNNLGVYLQNLGDLDAADDCLTRALAIKRESGASRATQATTVNNLARLACMRGQLRRGAEMFQQAVELRGDAWGTSSVNALVNCELTKIILGETEQSFAVLEQAELLSTELGDHVTLFHALEVRADLLRDLGRLAEARCQAHAAKECAEGLGQPRHRAQARVTLGMAYLGLRELEAARGEFTEALAIAERVGEREPETDALLGLAEYEMRVGDLVEAERYARRAHQLAQACGKVKEGNTLALLARIELAGNRLDQAIRHAERALAVHRSTEYHLGQARALRVLGEAQRTAGHERDACAHLQLARQMFTAFGSPEADQMRALA